MNTQQEVRVSYHNTHATKSFGICQRILQFQQECDVAPAGRFGFADCRAMRQSITVEINRKLQSDHFKSSKDEIKKNLRLRWRPICSMADAWKQHQASKSERLAPIPTTSARNVMLQESIWIYVWVHRGGGFHCQSYFHGNIYTGIQIDKIVKSHLLIPNWSKRFVFNRRIEQQSTDLFAIGHGLLKYHICPILYIVISLCHFLSFPNH